MVLDSFSFSLDNYSEHLEFRLGLQAKLSQWGLSQIFSKEFKCCYLWVEIAPDLWLDFTWNSIAPIGWILTKLKVGDKKSGNEEILNIAEMLCILSAATRQSFVPIIPALIDTDWLNTGTVECLIWI